MNLVGAAGVTFSVAAFAATYRYLALRKLGTRLAFLIAFGSLAIPSVLFAVYYLHILPEREWFYEFRSWTGTELLVVFLGCAAAATASLLPRILLAVPLAGLLVFGAVPYVKPVVSPIREDVFREMWDGDACLQSTASTCGPASVATILRHLGMKVSEKDVARAAFSSATGTEAWYLARYVRSLGFRPRFEFRSGVSADSEFPAVVGVRIGSAGHFIALLDISDGIATFSDPLSGMKRLPVSDFRRRYEFTAFRMVIRKG